VTQQPLSLRALNRATLGRQLLLERSSLSALDAVAHLVGLQAQEPLDPYLALWSRLATFDPRHLGGLLERRQVVRTALMRSTIHLVTADDCLALRPVMQPVLAAELTRHSQYGPALRGVDLEAMIKLGDQVLAKEPLSGSQLRAAMAERFPDVDPGALAYVCRNHLPLVQVPPRGVWGSSGPVRSMTATAWLGRPLARRPSIDDAVLRYLAAFGPATVADVSTWSRLTGLRAVMERLRPRLRVLRDDRGRELFDLNDAALIDEDTPAPTRFLPEYDNVLLSHADRGRFVAPEGEDRRRRVEGPVHGSVLHDGFLAATWSIERDEDRGDVTLVVRAVAATTTRDRDQIEAEGERAVRFLEPDAAAHQVRIRPAPSRSGSRTS
jgi:hypothetical protein